MSTRVDPTSPIPTPATLSHRSPTHFATSQLDPITMFWADIAMAMSIDPPFTKPRMALFFIFSEKFVEEVDADTLRYVRPFCGHFSKQTLYARAPVI